MGGGRQGWMITAAALAWVAGVALQLQQARLCAVSLSIAGLSAGVVGLLAGVAVLRRQGPRPVPSHAEAPAPAALGPALAWATVLLSLAVIAFFSTNWRASSRLAQVLPAALEGQDLRVTGRVARMPQLDAEGLRFVFEVESAVRAGAAGTTPVSGLPPQLWLSWSRGWQEDALVAGPPAALHAGERWELPVRLKRPHGVLNPEGFDAELWLFEQGIGGVGSVRASAPTDPRWLGGARLWMPLALIERGREHLRDRLLLQVTSGERAGVLAALAVGDQAAIDGPQWDLFRQTGVAHLMSISGLHITLFAALASWGLGWVWRRSAWLCLRWPAPLAARWCGVVLATGYALLSGWGVPAQRTVWMLVATAALQTGGWRWPAWLVCGVTAALVSAMDPWALMQPGFWLSFGAVALLLLSDTGPAPLDPAATRWQRVGRSLRAGLKAQAVATVGLAPLGMLLFHQLSLVGLLANAVAVPWVTLVVTPLALAGMAFPPAWDLAALALQPLLAVLAALAAWGGSGWMAPAVPAWAGAAAVLGAAVLVLPLPWRVRALGLPLCLPLAWPAVQRPAPGHFELVAVDVGQGSAVLVRTRDHLLIHDAGPQFSRDSDAGRRVLLPLLWARGERRIDELVLSHRDLDHVGGAPALLDGLPVSRLRSSLEPGHLLRQRPLPQWPCEAGQRWTWDGVSFEVLHPPPGPPDPQARPNHLSCTLRVQGSGGHSALLTGDIEAAQEARLVSLHGAALATEVLVVPHHGSKTSSTPAFLAAVHPSVAVIQVAYRSRFGHPHPEVLARYAALGIPVVRTDDCGGWVWRDDGAWCTRDVRRRYWHWAAGV